MIHWAWVPVTLLIGVAVGILIVALAETSREDDHKHKWWEE